MKKLFLGLVLLLTVGLFGAKNVQADNASTDAEKAYAMTDDIKGEPEAYVADVKYDSDGEIHVQVNIKNGERDRNYRVKVTPTSQITGVVVEGSLYCWAKSSECGSVIFHCKAGKEGDASYCVAYTFIAEIVN